MDADRPRSSGVFRAIDAMPDKESKILHRRLGEHRVNMEATLRGSRPSPKGPVKPSRSFGAWSPGGICSRGEEEQTLVAWGGDDEITALSQARIWSTGGGGHRRRFVVAGAGVGSTAARFGGAAAGRHAHRRRRPTSRRMDPAAAYSAATTSSSG